MAGNGIRIWLIRHAKSSWDSSARSDFERPLNARGQRDGPRMARWLTRQDHPATWIWTSSAARALATTRFVQEGFAVPESRVVALDELYHASPETMVDVLRRTPAEVESAALVAHNPGLTWLVNALGREPVTDNLPTFGVARFRAGGTWTDLAAGSAELELFASPKTIGD